MSTLLSNGALGKTIFAVAGSFALCADFQKDIDASLAKLVDVGITEETFVDAKMEMTATTQAFKVTH